MFKRIGNLLFIVLLVTSTSGITIFHHYCAGNFIKTSIFLEPKPCCKDHCDSCHNESTTLKIQDDYTVSYLPVELGSPVKELASHFPIVTVEQYIYTHFFLKEHVRDVGVKPYLSLLMLAEDKESLLQIFLL